MFNINVAVYKEDFNKEVDEVVKYCKKVDKSIVFVGLLRNKITGKFACFFSLGI